MWRGSFIGYCASCAEFEYEYTRTSGFLGDGVPYLVSDVPTAFDTYLKGVSLEDIGLPLPTLPTPLCRSKNVDVYDDDIDDQRMSYSELFDSIVPQTTFADNDTESGKMNEGFYVSDEDDEEIPTPPKFIYMPEETYQETLQKYLSEIEALNTKVNKKIEKIDLYMRLWQTDREQINRLTELISTLEAELELR